MALSVMQVYKTLLCSSLSFLFIISTSSHNSCFIMVHFKNILASLALASAAAAHPASDKVFDAF
jgi:hypothetical protein